MTYAKVLMFCFLQTAIVPVANAYQGAIIVTCGDADPNCEGAAARYQAQQEQMRIAAQRKAKVDAEVKKLGEHRRAEAERLVSMKEAADRARPKASSTCSRRGKTIMVWNNNHTAKEPFTPCLDPSKVSPQ